MRYQATGAIHYAAGHELGVNDKSSAIAITGGSGGIGLE